MTAILKRPAAAPALFRLLAESALSRAALGACGVAVAMVEAGGKPGAVSFANAAFESLFGYSAHEICGKPLAQLFRGDEALVQRLLDGPRRWDLTAWGKDRAELAVEVRVAAVRSVEGTLTHWVLAFADRGELERLRAEVESLKALAASSLALRQLAGQPAGGAEKARVEAAPADELYPDRKAVGVLQQR